MGRKATATNGIKKWVVATAYKTYDSPISESSKSTAVPKPLCLARGTVSPTKADG